ncbi:MAG: hypothetical protein HFG23_08990 [Anaerotruncus sp.]|nr:hypothetical protein [Anaerotruncus sp.]
MKHFKSVSAVLAVLAALSCCAPAPKDQPEHSSAVSSMSDASEPDTSSAPEAPAGPLLAGRAPNLKPFPCEQGTGPEEVVEQLSQLTGWDLTLSRPPVLKGDGLSVSFAPESSLFAGPPNPQKDQFHVFDAQDLVYSILDSVSASLQSVCGVSEVYFTAADGGDLQFEAGGYAFVFPAGQPYEVDVPQGTASAGYIRHTIRFPAYQGGRTEANAKIYDIPPFQLSIDLPDSWTVRNPDEELYSIPTTPVEFYEGDALAGSAGYHIFKIPEGIDERTAAFYRGVYNQIMLGSRATWDIEYTPISETESSLTATCYAGYVPADEADGQPAEEEEWVRRQAILSYNTDLLVYVAIAFGETEIPEEQWQAIAKSVQIEPL